MTRALEEGLGCRGCASAGTWLLPELCGGVRDGHLELLRSTAAGRGEQQVLAVHRASAGDLESAGLCAHSAAAIRKVLLPAGRALKSPLHRSRSFSSESSCTLCTCTSRHAKPRVPWGKRKKRKKEKRGKNEKEIERAHEVTKPY